MLFFKKKLGKIALQASLGGLSGDSDPLSFSIGHGAEGEVYCDTFKRNILIIENSKNPKGQERFKQLVTNHAKRFGAIWDIWDVDTENVNVDADSETVALIFKAEKEMYSRLELVENYKLSFSPGSETSLKRILLTIDVTDSLTKRLDGLQDAGLVGHALHSLVNLGSDAGILVVLSTRPNNQAVNGELRTSFNFIVSCDNDSLEWHRETFDSEALSGAFDFESDGNVVIHDRSYRSAKFESDGVATLRIPHLTNTK